jgi:hypothetical protein
MDHKASPALFDAGPTLAKAMTLGSEQRVMCAQTAGYAAEAG